MNTSLDILIVDDDPQMRSALEATVRQLGCQVTMATNGEEALQKLHKQNFDLVISDMRMPVMNGEELLRAIHETYKNLPVVMVTAYGTINQAVEAMRLGAYDFITKPFSFEDIEGLLSRINKKTVSNSTTSVSSNNEVKKLSKDSVAIVTNDNSMKELLEIITHVASSSASVLIQGESGTGKELIAKLLHSANRTVTGPFVAVNCAALPENLLESELFGHEKGSFTGASQTRIGKFEQADGGTLLLDEITEMPLSLQAKLLRVLQEREIDRVGGSKPIPVQVRIVATTNRPMEEFVKKGEFREDLYYRLNVIPIYIPALRDRKNDIKLLAEYFVKRFSEGEITRLDTTLVNEIEAYNWPGNIRELQNACERAVLLSSAGGGFSKTLEAKHFFMKQASKQSTLASNIEIKAGLSVADGEKLLIFETLKATSNNRTKAAELLGISIRTLRNKLHEYGQVVDSTEGTESDNLS